MKLYIVTGSSGEYSDRQEWLVAAYFDEKLAQIHVDRATIWFRVNVPKQPQWPKYRYEDREKKNPYDPEMHIDYTGTSWYLQSVDVRSELPAVPLP